MIRHSSMDRRRCMLAFFYLCGCLTIFVEAANIAFRNCLDVNILRSNPKQLQFTPLFFDASFNRSLGIHHLNVTIYGNVSGQATVGSYPPPDAPNWKNANDSFGKIVDISDSNNKYTTLFSKFKVLQYTPYNANPAPFCQSVVGGSCPIGPSFGIDPSDQDALPRFSIAHDFQSSFSFASIESTIQIQSGDKEAPYLGCINAIITPELGSTLSDALKYSPVAVLTLVALATVFAAIFSPWGTSDPFRWTSNLGRDEDLLRLVTPGFGDCLQYIQFIVLAGSLNLAYPGYYQPVVSQVAWSTLLFNQSLVSHGKGYNALADGLYNISSDSYGLVRLSQLIGMSDQVDIWADMAVWLLGLTGGIVILCQLGFLIRWVYMSWSKTAEEDLRSKNLPFTAGHVVRMCFNYFFLPIVALSFFQLLIASSSPSVVVAMTGVLLALIVGFVSWISWFIFATRPRAQLFDDLPTVLMYGPLYNTYSDDAAPFAFIPVLLTFIRGLAIGAIQKSGIAQIVVLAICEVIYILTLHAFRPFQAPTSMNAYHTFFCIVRLVTTLLSVAFVPNLKVAESTKGWLGYVILLLHAIVLVFGFFLNSMQTIIEVAARLAGAGGESRGGLTAMVLGKRALAKRAKRNTRGSLSSNAAMLGGGGDNKSVQLDGRSRSMSASSAILLNQAGDQRASSGFDNYSQVGDFSGFSGGGASPSPGPGTPGGITTPFSYIASNNGSAPPSSRRPTLTSRPAESTDPYYRPPRPRRQTIERGEIGSRGRVSWASNSEANRFQQDPEAEAGLGLGTSQHRASLTPAYLRTDREDSDSNLPDRRNDTDYTVRESDFYYGVSRGPALSSGPARRLGTGPADPTGPVSSATGWIKGLFGAKRKDKVKGFEVVRSQRAPELMEPVEEDELSPPVQLEPYHDSPQKVQSRGLDLEESADRAGQEESSNAPMLAPLDLDTGLDLPSRFGSRASSHPYGVTTSPSIPRKSSRRSRSVEGINLNEAPPLPSQHPLLSNPIQNLSSISVPFSSTGLSPPDGNESNKPGSVASSIDHSRDDLPEFSSRDNSGADGADIERPMSTGHVNQHLARESIRPGNDGASSNLGSMAELVDDLWKNASASLDGQKSNRK